MRRLLLCACALALAAPAGAEARSLVFFQTPSHNIGCAFSDLRGEPPFLRCDLRAADRIPPRPRTCDLDFGTAFGLPVRGRARRLCAGDTVLNDRARVLRYGARRRLGPFTCTSRRVGLRCTSRSGHGFFLSRRRQRLF